MRANQLWNKCEWKTLLNHLRSKLRVTTQVIISSLNNNRFKTPNKLNLLSRLCFLLRFCSIHSFKSISLSWLVTCLSISLSLFSLSAVYYPISFSGFSWIKFVLISLQRAVVPNEWAGCITWLLSFYQLNYARKNFASRDLYKAHSSSSVQDLSANFIHLHYLFWLYRPYSTHRPVVGEKLYTPRIFMPFTSFILPLFVFLSRSFCMDGH